MCTLCLTTLHYRQIFGNNQLTNKQQHNRELRCVSHAHNMILTDDGCSLLNNRHICHMANDAEIKQFCSIVEKFVCERVGPTAWTAAASGIVQIMRISPFILLFFFYHIYTFFILLYFFIQQPTAIFYICSWARGRNISIYRLYSINFVWINVCSWWTNWEREKYKKSTKRDRVSYGLCEWLHLIAPRIIILTHAHYALLHSLVVLFYVNFMIFFLLFFCVDTEKIYQIR